jgi:hypothetical protein
VGSWRGFLRMVALRFGRQRRDWSCLRREGQTAMSDCDAKLQICRPNQGAAANRRPAGQSDGSSNLSAIVAADRAFPAAVAGLGG